MTAFMAWLDMHPLFWPVFIFSARVVDVSIGTLRTICVIRGMRWVASVLGFVEVTVWVTAISGVLHHLGQWYNVVAYASGFATGNACGIFIEQRLAMGMQAVRFISRSRSAAVAAGLRLAGYAVTEILGRGLEGDVTLSLVVAPRKDVPTIIRIAHQIDSEVVSTVEDVRSARLRHYPSPIASTSWFSAVKKK